MSKVSKINTLVLNGIKAEKISVEIHTSAGIPSFKIVGLADKTIAESKERVKAALNSMSFAMPAKKILVNLAPANLAKEGSHFDLPIAIAILTQLAIIDANEISKYFILGELSLNAEILSVPGILPSAVYAKSNEKGIICPYDNLEEAQWSTNNKILAAKNIIEIVNHFKGKSNIASRKTSTILAQQNDESYLDLSEIKGQKVAKRALLISAAGNHNLLMSGPPGTGKSMLAKALPGILPKMTPQEILECSMIYSVAGLISKGMLQADVPFRSPHHSASLPAIIGGGIGKKVKPGEVSLAHNGVLFLDELPEFNSNIIDSLRQPMETQEVLIARADSHVTYPANFQIIAAMNPCKCGYFGDETRECSKAPICSQNYLNKISGPILDRFAICVNVQEDIQSITKNQNIEESSAKIRIKVENARVIQKERYKNCSFNTNARASNEAIEKFSKLDTKCQKIIESAMKKFKLSMRGYISVIKVARTIADIEASDTINEIHISEAISYRMNNY